MADDCCHCRKNNFQLRERKTEEKKVPLSNFENASRE